MDRLTRFKWQIRGDLKKYRPKMLQTLMRRHAGQSRGTSGARRNGVRRSSKTIFSREG
jgi:hypothetical protein